MTSRSERNYDRALASAYTELGENATHFGVTEYLRKVNPAFASQYRGCKAYAKRNRKYNSNKTFYKTWRRRESV